MKRYLTFSSLLAITLFFITTPSSAQEGKLRASLKASVSQTIGTDTKITIEYSRPGVKGRTIWGDLVPYGMNPGNKYSKNKPFPWRAGANENTTIEFSKDVMVEGHKLAAGKYGIHMIPSKKDWTIIFSKDNAAWGSFSYDETNDALRITVTPVAGPFEEWLSYGFDNLDGTKATAFLHWEKLKVPFNISIAE